MDISGPLLWRVGSTWALATALAAFAYGARHWLVRKPSTLTGAQLWGRACLAALGSVAILGLIYALGIAAHEHLAWDRSVVLVTLALVVYVPAGVAVFVAAFRLATVREGLVVLALFWVLPLTYIALMRLMLLALRQP